MEKIENPKEYEICEFDGVNQSTVYIGFFNDLEKAHLEWHKEFVSGLEMEVGTLTLKEIKEQICTDEHRLPITIFINSPLHGKILQYGNYGDLWYEIGETCGYA